MGFILQNHPPPNPSAQHLAILDYPFILKSKEQRTYCKLCMERPQYSVVMQRHCISRHPYPPISKSFLLISSSLYSGVTRLAARILAIKQGKGDCSHCQLCRLSFNPHVFHTVLQPVFSCIWYLWTQIFFRKQEEGEWGAWLPGWSKWPLLALNKSSCFQHCFIPSPLEVTGTSNSWGFLLRTQCASVATSPEHIRVFLHSTYWVTNNSYAFHHHKFHRYLLDALYYCSWLCEFVLSFCHVNRRAHTKYLKQYKTLERNFAFM